MKKILFIFFLGFYTIANGQVTALGWAKKLPAGFGSQASAQIVTDSEENIYVSGYYMDTMDLDPGPGVFRVDLDDENILNCFIAKYDDQGSFIWAKIFEKAMVGNGNSLALSQDRLFFAGTFIETTDFDPGPGVYNLTGEGLNDVFIAKLDTSGNFIWAKRIGSAEEDYLNEFVTDQADNLYLSGSFKNVVDFDPGPGTYNLTSHDYRDAYIMKLNPDGDLIWAKNIGAINNGGGTGPDSGNSTAGMAVDDQGNVYSTGVFYERTDFDPGVNTYYVNSLGYSDAYILKQDSNGEFLWVKTFGSSNIEGASALKLDSQNNIITTGNYSAQMDINPGPGVHLISPGNNYLLKLDSQGDFIWGNGLPEGTYYAFSIVIDDEDRIYIPTMLMSQLSITTLLGNLHFQESGGTLLLTIDENGDYLWGSVVDTPHFNIPVGISRSSNGNLYVTTTYEEDINASGYYIFKFGHKHVYGNFYKDFNENCQHDAPEYGLENFTGIIEPGGITVQSNAQGYWLLDSLPAGNYTLFADTTASWRSNCNPIQNFTVISSDITTFAGSIDLQNDSQCTEPEVSINMPFIRRCFENQQVYVQSCNQVFATDLLTGAYTEIQLDENLVFQSASLASTDLGNNTYRFNHGDLYPGQCADFTINVQVSCNAVLGQTLCMEANLYPADSCVFDTIPAPNPLDFVPCGLPWDHSSLSVEGWCQNDSIYFTVTNTGDPGDGNMDCYSPVRLYIDGQYMWLDSLLLTGGETRTYVFSGDGRTWRLEADQHPLHPGNSHPNARLEACGNTDNWTPDLMVILPPDDADPVVDIYCGAVTGSYDPNDKTGYPLGVGSSHLVQPNGKLEYLVRFQNTGTDTAFTVVVRDTLDTDLNIFSVRSGVSSHAYSFRMYGPRVLEWTFNNIFLPDSTANEPGSHGFVTFEVDQNPNLADSTEITNNVGIYFDFNDPVITNTTMHKVGRGIQNTQTRAGKILNFDQCDPISYNGITYSQSGEYFQLIDGGVNPDTLLTLNVVVKHSTSYISESVCSSYTAPDLQVYTQSGTYTAIIPNSFGCDSTITINLTIKNPTSSTLTESACVSYTAPDMQIYTQSGTYTAIVPNAAGCDSMITINLTIKNPSSSTLTESVCDSYTAPDLQVYTQSGTYIAVVPNAAGCDSTITINLTVNSFESTITQQNATLSSTMSGDTYQWIDCLDGNQAMPGETNQSFTATANGEYAVIVAQNDCSDTSECVLVSSVGLEALLGGGEISIYPNPTDNSATVFLGEVHERINYTLTTVSGQVIEQQSGLSGENFSVDLSKQANGIYFLTLDVDGKRYVLKLMKD